MQFGHINPTGEEWRWLKFQKSDLELEIKVPTTEDLVQMPDAKASTKEAREYIARNLFRDFKGAADATGNPLPNNPDVRALILNDFAVWLFVNANLMRLSARAAEKNGDSASA